MTNYSIVERPSEAPFSANRGSFTVNYKYKTLPCRNFWFTRRCHFGDRCKFFHLPEESQRSCRYNSRSTCPYGERCMYPHRESDYYAGRREDLYTENSANNTQPVDVDSWCNTRECTKLMIVDNDINTNGSVCNYALGQEGSRRFAPVLASESENAHAAPKTLVKNAFPSEVQKPLKPTASKHRLPPPRVSSFKWTRPKKIVGIYADWIDE
uniref:C3H1-type domain-containing protein n=1 Tax=Chenopodium quinoa TaxID=63459 RepID=A0A803LN46_CHEQI